MSSLNRQMGFKEKVEILSKIKSYGGAKELLRKTKPKFSILETEDGARIESSILIGHMDLSVSDFLRDSMSSVSGLEFESVKDGNRIMDMVIFRKSVSSNYLNNPEEEMKSKRYISGVFLSAVEKSLSSLEGDVNNDLSLNSIPYEDRMRMINRFEESGGTVNLMRSCPHRHMLEPTEEGGIYRKSLQIDSLSPELKEFVIRAALSSNNLEYKVTNGANNYTKKEEVFLSKSVDAEFLKDESAHRESSREMFRKVISSLNDYKKDLENSVKGVEFASSPFEPLKSDNVIGRFTDRISNIISRSKDPESESGMNM